MEIIKTPQQMFRDGWCTDCLANYKDCVMNNRCQGCIAQEGYSSDLNIIVEPNRQQEYTSNSNTLIKPNRHVASIKTKDEKDSDKY